MSVIELPVRSPEEEELLHPVLAPETANSEPPDTGERRERSFAHSTFTSCSGCSLSAASWE